MAGRYAIAWLDGQRLEGFLVGGQYVVEALGDAQTFVIQPAQGGDANLDGQVGVNDLGVLALNWGCLTSSGWCMGDFNGDNIVDVGDLAVLAINWGATSVGGLPPWQVPEPAAMVLLLMAGPALLRRGRRAAQ